MKSLLVACVAAVALAFCSSNEAAAQYPGYVRPGNYGETNAFAGLGFVGRMSRARPQPYYSQTLSNPGYSYTTGRGPFGPYSVNSLYGPGYSYTLGRGPYGNFSQNTLYGSGYSYTSGYGVSSYGPVYGGGFAPYGYGFGGGY